MATQQGELPVAKLEKLDRDCHDSSLDLAQDIARNLQIQVQSGASIKGDTGKPGATGPAAKDGKDGKDGVTPELTTVQQDLEAGQQDVTGVIPIDKDPFVEYLWQSSTVNPTEIPKHYFTKDIANSFLDIKFIAAVVGDSWAIKISYF